MTDMTSRILAFLLLLSSLLCHPSSGHATPLIADLSNYRIAMDSSFNGTRMFLFGARNAGGDVVVVVRGPLRNFVVRKKEEFAGLWVNRSRMKFWGIPEFYAIAASKPLDRIESGAVFSRLGLGEKQLFSRPPARKAQEFADFSAAFVAHQRADRLYVGQPGEIGFMGETLFKTVIEFPDNIPPGDYTAEIYLLSGGEIVGMQSMPIKVVKTGLDAFFYDFAHGRPLLYGLTAIVLALSAGWFAGRLFEKI